MSMTRHIGSVAVSAVGLFLFLIALPVLSDTVVEDGDVVAIEFALKLDDGTHVDGTEGQDPYVFTIGDPNVLQSLQAALKGRSPGEELDVRLSPDDAYGEWDSRRLQEVPAEIIPEESRQEGAWLDGRNADGRAFRVRVHELRGDQVVLDGNHPLAGEHLNFEVRILSVEPGITD